MASTLGGSAKNWSFRDVLASVTHLTSGNWKHKVFVTPGGPGVALRSCPNSKKAQEFRKLAKKLLLARKNKDMVNGLIDEGVEIEMPQTSDSDPDHYQKLPEPVGHNTSDESPSPSWELRVMPTLSPQICDWSEAKSQSVPLFPHGMMCPTSPTSWTSGMGQEMTEVWIHDSDFTGSSGDDEEASPMDDAEMGRDAIQTSAPEENLQGNPDAAEDDLDVEQVLSPAMEDEKGPMPREPRRKRSRLVTPSPVLTTGRSRTNSKSRLISSGCGRRKKFPKSAGSSKMSEEVTSLGQSDTNRDKKKVECIIAVRTTREFLVQWKGYGPKYDSWEPEAHLVNCEEDIQDIEKGLSPGAESQSGSPPPKKVRKHRSRRLPRSP